MKNPKYYWAMCLCLLAIPFLNETSAKGFSISETFSIQGKVTEFKNGQDVISATVSLFLPEGKKVNTTVSGETGSFFLQVPGEGNYIIKIYKSGFQTLQENVNLKKGSASIHFKLKEAPKNPEQTAVQLNKTESKEMEAISEDADINQKQIKCTPSLSIQSSACSPMNYSQNIQTEKEFNTEQYDYMPENEFKDVKFDPLSTFSIDVDRASYANVRRFIAQGQMPPVDAVRIEEMINYFKYDYPSPMDEHPFSIHTEIGACPWNTKNKIVMIGIQGKEISSENLPPSNLVFLIDVSGSMNTPNKLPLVKESLRLLVAQLRAEDKISIVVYAGAAGLVLEPTSGNKKNEIMEAIDRLQAGGSTAGGAGIKLAYQTARKNYSNKKNNRVILATDGDFNVGTYNDGELVRMIEVERASGVFLTVLGFGMGNYKDSRMEKLADHGNGNYAYIDNIMEAQKTLGSEFGGTLFTIAKDVKIQVEFNPAEISSYKLIGYENRVLAKEDFNNDKKDAGDLGSGHTVTALYEVVPTGTSKDFTKVDPLRYQVPNLIEKNAGQNPDELLTVKLRYKKPDETASKLITKHVSGKQEKNISESENLQFALAVAEFGMLLRDSKFKGESTYAGVLRMARTAKGVDLEGYRAEFIRLVEQQMNLAQR